MADAPLPPIIPESLSAGEKPPFTLPPHVIEQLQRGETGEAMRIIQTATRASDREARALVKEIRREIERNGPGISGPERPRTRLAPGEVSRGGGAGKWVALAAVAALAVGAALFFR